MKTPTTRRFLFVLLASAGMAMFPARAQAATYSLAGDFSYTENRADSVWSFRLVDGAQQTPAFLPLLTSTNRNAKTLWGPDFAAPPAMWSEGSGYWGIGKNTTGVAQTGSGVTWAPGEVLLHPKGGAAPAGLAIVWTAPTKTVLDVNYTFSRCMAQGNGVGYELIKRSGGADAVLANDAVGSSLTRTLQGVSVAAGDQLIFRFDTLGDPSGDITKAAIEITPAAGPAVAVTPVAVTPPPAWPCGTTSRRPDGLRPCRSATDGLAAWSSAGSNPSGCR